MDKKEYEEIEVRARKSPWIETGMETSVGNAFVVRARKSPWIETDEHSPSKVAFQSGLVRARGLKPVFFWKIMPVSVRARKSPWIETQCNGGTIAPGSQGS